MQNMNIAESAAPEFQPSELVEYGKIEEITQAGTSSTVIATTDSQQYS